MKYNNSIDFFSSPNSRFIGFTDIRHPQPDHTHHLEPAFQPIDDQRKTCRKLSFNASNPIDAIMPFGPDFFDQKLQECDEPDEYSHKDQLENQQNSLMIDAHFRAPFNIMKSPVIKPKDHGFLSTPHTMRIQCQDMAQSERKEYDIPCKIQNSQNYTTPKRKSELFSNRKSCDSTAEKSMSRNNQKGLRRLSNLAYSIVSQSTTTTYKEVAQKLLNHLNFNNTEIEEEDGNDRSSMQNVKRRVYDSLNVLLALGVIKRVGSKIAKQKQKKPFTTDNSPDLQRYNEMLAEYNQRVKALEARRKTEAELKQKLDLFRKTIERNKRSKGIAKNKMIKLPFLAFMSGQEADVEWGVKEVEQEEKKKGKRSQMREMEKKEDEQVVKVRFGRGVPESYGDLDLFRLLQESEVSGSVLKERESVNVKGIGNEEMEFEYGIEYREDGMNLIDEVLGEERSRE